MGVQSDRFVPYSSGQSILFGISALGSLYNDIGKLKEVNGESISFSDDLSVKTSYQTTSLCGFQMNRLPLSMRKRAA